jgi:hypothetical protein
LDAFAAAVEASGIGVFARTSVWAYPVANVIHVLAATVLIGAVLVIDLRWLGWLAQAPAEAVSRAFSPLFAAALTLMLLSGSVLFAADARALVGSWVFGTKLAVIALALANALVFRSLRPERQPARAPLAAITSLALWFSVVILGRLIAYL